MEDHQLGVLLADRERACELSGGAWTHLISANDRIVQHLIAKLQAGARRQALSKAMKAFGTSSTIRSKLLRRAEAHLGIKFYRGRPSHDGRQLEMFP